MDATTRKYWLLSNGKTLAQSEVGRDADGGGRVDGGGDGEHGSD